MFACPTEDAPAQLMLNVAGSSRSPFVRKIREEDQPGIGDPDSIGKIEFQQFLLTGHRVIHLKLDLVRFTITLLQLQTTGRDLILIDHHLHDMLVSRHQVVFVGTVRYCREEVFMQSKKIRAGRVKPLFQRRVHSACCWNWLYSVLTHGC